MVEVNLAPLSSRPIAELIDVLQGSLPYRRILREHSNYCPRTAHSKRFLHDTMAYVTPWNNHGYDVAKWFNGTTVTGIQYCFAD